MESATILMPPSTGLSGILLSVRTQYSRRTRICKISLWPIVIADIKPMELCYRCYTVKVTKSEFENVEKQGCSHV